MLNHFAMFTFELQGKKEEAELIKNKYRYHTQSTLTIMVFFISEMFYWKATCLSVDQFVAEYSSSGTAVILR